MDFNLVQVRDTYITYHFSRGSHSTSDVSLLEVVSIIMGFLTSPILTADLFQAVMHPACNMQHFDFRF